jgi:tRNA(Arg) A34 adenosine deaminase TadA
VSDDVFLRRAIELAIEAREAGNMPYGSLLVGPSGEVLIEDRNTVLTDGDISAHPEFKLALWASRELSPEDARRTTMYTSTHPCPMCAGAIERSGLGRVVFALSPEQHESIAPSRRPPVLYDGPSLFEEARVPIDGYYDR